MTHVRVFSSDQAIRAIISAENFQTIMTSVSAGIPGVAIYMDDIVVHGPNRKIHDERLDQVFQRLARQQLTVNNERCLLGVAEIRFVGHYILSKGISPSYHPKWRPFSAYHHRSRFQI